VLFEVRPTPGGRKVVAKQASSAEEAARLRREAEVLDIARHPGVVEVLGLDGDPARPVLLTSHVSGPTLAAAGPLAAEEVAGVLAAVASTLGDLHELGVVHGGLAGEHVILDAAGAPVLCGFGDGGRAGEEPPGGGERLDPSVDVLAVALLARSLCPSSPAEGAARAVPAAQGAARALPAAQGAARAVPAAQGAARALRRLADDILSADAGERPTARALADSISASVPGARLPRLRPQGGDAEAPAAPAPTTPDPLDAWRRLQSPPAAVARMAPRRMAAIAGAAALVLVGLVGAASLRTGSPSNPPVAMDEPVGNAGSPTTEPFDDGTTEATVPTPPPRPVRPDCPAVPPGLAADVDGDGCPDPLRYAGAVLEAGSARWSVGEVGDQVATGDWSCTGERTLALFRPATGELFRFEGWAAAGSDVSATAFAMVPGGLALRAADVDQDGCHEMVVERDGGPPEVVRPSRSTP